MVIEGKLHKKFDTEQVSEKFAKRRFVVAYSDNPLHPQLVEFECTQDRCAMVDAVKEGDNVEVTFNLRGREWVNPQGEKKYFTSLEAWRMQKVAGDSGSTQDLANRSPKLPGESNDFPFD